MTKVRPPIVSNLSVVQQNVINSMSEFGAKVFLRACERLPDDRLHYEAEAFAREHERVAENLTVLLPLAAKPHGEFVPDGLMKFILDRHWHSRFPGN